MQTITFNHLNLFASGPATTTPGPIRARQALGDTPGSSGEAMLHQGLHLREITQTGQLTADTAALLDEQVAAITAHLNGQPATLTDEHGRDWPGCVLSEFTPGPTTRLGPRFTLTYRITYRQLQPQ